MNIFNVDDFMKNDEVIDVTVAEVFSSENEGERQEQINVLLKSYKLDFKCAIEPLLRNANIAYETWKKSFQKHLEDLKDILETYRSDRPKYEANAKIWGTFGWSIFQQMPMGYLFYTPKSDIAATRFANQYFKQHPISELISDIKDFDSSKNTFFNEAVWQ